MQDSSEERDEISQWHDYVGTLEALVKIGEGKAAVDAIRKKVNGARQRPPADSAKLLRLLALYATILEETDALAEAEYIRTEAIDSIVSAQLEDRGAAEAFLRHGLLLIKMHNYDGAVQKFREAIRRVDALTNIEELDRQIVLARIWRGMSEAFEALGEFSQASNAIDTLMNVKRQIRFQVFVISREG